jgi:hypothetical protein
MKKIPLIILFVGIFSVIAFLVLQTKKVQKNNNITPSPIPINLSAVPLPQKEDIVRTFFNLISEGKAVDAVSMLSPNNTDTDGKRQIWAVMFSAFNNISIIKIESAGENTYRIDFTAEMKSDTKNVKPTPYYGFINGINTRWVTLEDIGGIWKIQGIATGP